jgi:predicted kinase
MTTTSASRPADPAPESPLTRGLHDPRRITVPVPGIVVLIGAAGAGKSTLAAHLFAAADIVSSDDVRRWVAGDPADQRATRVAFSIVHREVRRRLAAHELAVVDATNVERHARQTLLRIGRIAGVGAVAIVVRTQPDEVHARNAGRTERVVPAEVVERHLSAVAALGDDTRAVTSRLMSEGFATVHVVDGDIASIVVERITAGGAAAPAR